MKRKLFFTAAGTAAAFLFVISGVGKVNAKGTSLEIPLYHHHTENCMGDVTVIKEADGDQSLETISQREKYNLSKEKEKPHKVE